MSDYSFSDYNEDGSMKISGGTWLWLFYAARHALLLLGLSIARSTDMMQEMTGEGHWAYLLCSLPALLVLLTVGFRVPEAGPLPRRIWRMGRWLFIAAILLHLVIAVAVGLSSREWQFSIVQASCFGLDALALKYAFTSQYFRDVFAEFPASAKKD